MAEITWTAPDYQGVEHKYSAMAFGVLDALAILEAYKCYKQAQMMPGQVIPPTKWIPQILFGVPGHHCYRDGVAIDGGNMELIYSGQNLTEMLEAAEARAVAEGFFDIWMRQLILLHTGSDPAKSTTEPPKS